jgi:hypothetical protein
MLWTLVIINESANAIVKQADINVALKMATIEKVAWAPKG